MQTLSTFSLATRLVQTVSPLLFSTIGRHRVCASVAVRALSARGLTFSTSAIKALPATIRHPGTLRDLNPSSDGASNPTSTGAWNIICHTNGNHGAAWDLSLIPKYLHETYWWAYVHPLAIRFWDRHWLVNTILWGNYRRLRDQALMEIESSRCDKAAAAAAAAAASSASTPSAPVSNPTEAGLSMLHVSCVYNDFDADLVRNHMSASDTLHVVDVAPQQLENVQRKLSSESAALPSSIRYRRMVHLWQQDASRLSAFHGDSMDCVILFFLLHEVPDAVRRAALAEAVRVVRPRTGRLVIVDYDKVSSRLNPFYYIMKLVLSTLEPFAMDLWRTPLRQTLEEAAASATNSPCSTISVVRHDHYFGGMYQKLVVKKMDRGQP